MTQSKIALLQRPIVRYILVGGSVFLLELAVIFIAQRAGASGVVAVGIAFWIGLIVSFILQKFVTFADTRTHHKVIAAQFAAVTGLVLFNFAFTIAVTELTTNLVPAAISRAIALMVTTVWNYYLYRTSIFRGTIEPIY